jgi:hypothetical protein
MTTLLATWRPDGTHAHLSDETDGLWARLDLVDTWYPEGSRTPVRAWVVEWLGDSGEDPQMVRTALDEVPESAPDEDAMRRLSHVAAQVARASIPDAPSRPIRLECSPTSWAISRRSLDLDETFLQIGTYR